MQPTITIPHGWKYPRFTLGQRIEQGNSQFAIRNSQLKIIATCELRIGNCFGWRYLVMPDMNSIEEKNHLENEIKLLKPEELKTLLEAEIKKRLYQIEVLKYELKAIPGIVIHN